MEFNIKCSFDPIFQDYHFETRHKVEAFGIEKTNKLTFKCWEESGPEPGVAIGHRVDIEIESCSGIPLVLIRLETRNRLKTSSRTGG